MQFGETAYQEMKDGVGWTQTTRIPGWGLTKRLAGQNRLHGQRRGWGEERQRPEKGGSPVPLPLSPTLLKNPGPGAKMVKAAKPALQSDPARFMGCGVA